MHIACSGPTDSGKSTFVMEHGGGSNSLALKAIADDLAASHGRRACVYDRLGYGWTPSMYRKGKGEVFPTSGELLKSLLANAGETGPYTCVGHSAGGHACLRFALAVGDQVTGIAILDGYPDLISAGAFRPGTAHRTDSSPALPGTKLFGALVGPTGFSRLFIGNAGPDYEPQAQADAFKALYSQTRFWLSQYSDLAQAVDEGQDQFTWPLMGGVEDSRGIVTYGGTLNAHVLVLPADTTVYKICTADYEYNEYCCKDSNKDKDICTNQAEDSGMYLEQAGLYATSIGTSGAMEVAPRGAGHVYPQLKQYYPWVVERLLSHFPN
uniref:AB hydrolase-1 domain-containing protein n=1 Tax=Hemiselmis andersenii TaxID=464988 RepID=A0A6U5B7F5_HEMAN|mmetsp:Transcript_52043/g.126151  ORF Transcript_52043/g.126151 Transcript_52043/m.126151 type:complete len:324 (+) Transcript_52043:861-1832(+)